VDKSILTPDGGDEVTDRTVPIQVHITPEHYRSLVKIAEKRHVQAHHLIEQLVEHALRPSPAAVRERLRDDIRRLLATGRNDRQIAEHLGVKRGQVSYHRVDMGLPSNDKRGRKPQKKASTAA